MVHLAAAFLAIMTMSYGQANEWKLVWSDEFDYTGLPDKSKWDYEEGFAEQTNRRVRGVTAKSWRFAREMEEISSTFEGAGMPGGFHAAAAEVYRRIAG